MTKAFIAIKRLKTVQFRHAGHLLDVVTNALRDQAFEVSKLMRKGIVKSEPRDVIAF